MASDARVRTTTLAAPRPPRLWLIAAALIAVDLVFGALYLGSIYTPKLAFFRVSHGMWDLDAEGNVPSWYSSTQLFCVAVVVGVIAWREFRWRRLGTWPLLLATLLFAFLSADEGAEIHERVAAGIDRVFGGRAHTVAPRTGVWVFILGPTLLIFGLALAWAGRGYLLRDRVATAIGLAGGAIFLGAAVGLETYSNYLRVGGGYLTEVCVEEVSEMVGVTLMLWGAARLAWRIYHDKPDAPLAGSL